MPCKIPPERAAAFQRAILVAWIALAGGARLSATEELFVSKPLTTEGSFTIGIEGARHGNGTVVKLSSAGEVLKEIGVLGSKLSNLCFGGSDGRTVYVTEVERRRLVQFRVDRPGLAWRRWRE
jgi:hypothetical protein